MILSLGVLAWVSTGGATAASSAPADKDTKIASRVRPLVEGARTAAGGGAAARVEGDGWVRVRVQLDELGPDELTRLTAAGLDVEIHNARLAAARGWVRPADLPAVAALEDVRRIDFPDYARPRSGSVTGQHDAILRCDAVRTAYGVDGSGVRVGIVSDGIDHLADSQATGDAPGVAVPADARCRRGSGDEGTAIVELVHDCAPGAALGFCGPLDDLEMVDCLACLRESFGADVIVDDLGFAGQPFFEDGSVARAVEETVTAGVAYFTAAGNEAERHYQGRYRPCRSGSRHDFGGDDCTLNFFFTGTVGIVLQWAEPFGAAASDYDMCAPGLGCSENVQDGDDLPFEAFAVSCGLGQCTGELEVYKRGGEDLDLELYFQPLSGGLDVFEHRVLNGSTFGHACVPGAVTVGAIDAADADHDRIEGFSSRGPCDIRFPQAETRPKPDLAGIDGIANTRPGGFPSPFYGTSAAAPGVAAAGALLLQLDPSLPPAGLVDALTGGAVDLGPAGRDNTFGSGRVDVAAAATRIATPGGRATPTPTPGAHACTGDCSADGAVTVDEVVSGVAIALGTKPLPDCPAFDSDGSGGVTVDELVRAVNDALVGCGG